MELITYIGCAFFGIVGLLIVFAPLLWCLISAADDFTYGRKLRGCLFLFLFLCLLSVLMGTLQYLTEHDHSQHSTTQK